MTLREEIKEQWSLLRDMDWKQRWQQFCEYYLKITIAVVLAIAMLISVIVSITGKKEPVLHGVMVNSTLFLGEEDPYASLAQEFAQVHTVQSDRETVKLNGAMRIVLDGETTDLETYNSMQSLMAMIAAKELDFIVGDDVLESLAYSDYFASLETVLTEAELEAYRPYIRYIDQAVLEQIQRSDPMAEDTQPVVYHDMSAPEQMEKPIPVFLDVSGSERLQALYAQEEVLLLAVAANAPHPEMTRNWIAYVLEVPTA